MGQFFLFLEQIAPLRAAHARTLLRGFLRMSRRGNDVRIPEIFGAFGPQLLWFFRFGF